MTFVVDWAIDPTGALAVVSEEAIGELPSMARPGGVCVTVNGAVVVSERKPTGSDGPNRAGGRSS